MRVDERDPYGPADQPDLPAQRQALESLLKQKQWSYTVVDNREDFARELRSGSYSVLGLFSEEITLDHWTQKAIREAVHSGSGLLVAGIHDTRHMILEPALGIIKLGEHHGSTGLTLIAVPGLEGEAVFPIPDDYAVAIYPRTAKVIAEFTLKDIFDEQGLKWFGDENQKAWHEGVRQLRDRSDVDALNNDWIRWYWDRPDAMTCVPEHLRRWHWWRKDSFRMDAESGNWRSDDLRSSKGRYHGRSYCDFLSLKKPAVTLNQYGKGKAVFAGFDGLLQATAGGQDSLYFQLLNQALDQVHQDNGTLAEGQSQSVQLTIENLAIATPGRALLQLDGVSILDKASFTQEEDGWSYEFTIAEGQQLQKHLQVIVPPYSKAGTISALIQSGQEGQWRDHEALKLEIEAGRELANLDELIEKVRALSYESWKGMRYYFLLKKLEFIRQCLLEHNLRWAYESLLMSTSLLMMDKSSDAQEIRAGLQDVLLNVGRKIN
ncbi:MAG: hypothetical protein ACR2PX_08625 [Endozoicomonas sp.]|uniref:hypothetical protein n=1 Tax=Endozoicomonas sp. TaxID=1892382 RepID=UPI003D9B6F29